MSEDRIARAAVEHAERIRQCKHTTVSLREVRCLRCDRFIQVCPTCGVCPLCLLPELVK